MEQVRLFDLGPVAAAQRGMRSRARKALLALLQTENLTCKEVGRNVGCTGEFISGCAAGRKAPARWKLRVRFEQKYGIMASWWDEPEPAQ